MYSVLLKFLENLNSHWVFEFKGKIKFIAVTYAVLTQSSLTSGPYVAKLFTAVIYGFSCLSLASIAGLVMDKL
jgi:hypothetical protein